jgi:hypothetical protein
MDIEMGNGPSASPEQDYVVAHEVSEDSHIPTSDIIEVENESFGLINNPRAIISENWGVSREQFSAGHHVNAAILMIMLFVQEDGIFAQIVSVGSVYVLFILIQKYFGYVLQCSDGSSVCCNIPLPQFKKIAFPNDRSISFPRWLNGILMWITEIFLLMSKSSYQYLETNAHFPDQHVMEILFIVQFLVSLGCFDALHRYLVNNR